MTDAWIARGVMVQADAAFRDTVRKRWKERKNNDD